MFQQDSSLPSAWKSSHTNMQSTPLETRQSHPTNLKSFHKYQVTSTPKTAPCQSQQTSLKQPLPLANPYLQNPSSANTQFDFHSDLKPILKCRLSSHEYWVCFLETSFCSLDLCLFSWWLYLINSTVCTIHKGVHSSPLFMGFLFPRNFVTVQFIFHSELRSYCSSKTSLYVTGAPP